MGGSVVLVEDNDAGVGECFFEFEDVSDVRASERVDRLVAVTDDEDVAVFVGKFEHHVVLCGVGVLVFVDKDVLEALPVVVKNVGVVVEKFDCDSEEVIEVHGACYSEASLIFNVSFGDFAVIDISRAVDSVVGGDQFVFQVRDFKFGSFR